MFISNAHASAGLGGFDLMGILPIILIFGVFYFLIIRPQQTKIKKHQETLSSIKKGDRVVTGGGIIGSIYKVLNEQELLIEVAEGVCVNVLRSTVAQVLKKEQIASISDKHKIEKKSK